MPPNTTAFSSLLAVILAMLSITLGASLAKSLFPLIRGRRYHLVPTGMRRPAPSLVFRIWRMPFDRRTLLGPSPMGCRSGP